MSSWHAALDATPANHEQAPASDHGIWQVNVAATTPTLPRHHHTYPPYPSAPSEATAIFRNTMHHPASSTPNPYPDSGSTRFVHTQCDQDLFSSEYLRSNKASGHKNLRCFPHCCGGHNPKSFCGSGLVVECSLPRAQIALGCFEEVPKPSLTLSSDVSTALAQGGKSPANPASNQSDDTGSGDTLDEILIQVGEEYARPGLFHELKSSENPFGKWFKGVPVLSATEAQRFHLNGNRQSWHYGWQSSRLNCKHLHVFKVYFFTADTHKHRDTLRCIATLSSPPFRISSSRKARKTFKTSPSLQSLGSISDDQLSMPQSSPRVYEDDERLSVDSTDDSLSSLPVTLASLRGRASFDLAAAASSTSSHAVRTTNSHTEVLPSLRTRVSRGESFSSTTSSSAVHSHNGYRGQPDRKRLTRSSSLQTDYYSSYSGPFPSPGPRQPRAQTFLGEEPPPRNRMLSLTSLLNAEPPPEPTPPGLEASTAVHTDHAYDLRVHVPPTNAVPLHVVFPDVRHVPPVSTPVSDMMQLQLGTPRVLTRPASTSSLSRPPFTGHTTGHRARRKRNRSVDSGPSTQPVDGTDGSVREWFDGPILHEIAPHGEWDPVAQAHALGLLLAIASRLTRVHEPPSNNSTPGGFQVAWKARDGTVQTTRISAETKPALSHLCDVILETATQLIAPPSAFLQDVRTTMQLLFQNYDSSTTTSLTSQYEALLELVLPRVEAQLSRTLRRPSDAPTPTIRATTPSVLVEMLHHAESELVREPWVRDLELFDEDDDEYPLLEVFTGYAQAVQLASAYSDLVLPSVTAPTLTGDWRLVQASTEDTSVDAPSSRVATWLPTPTLRQQLELYEFQLYRILETSDSLTLTLGNSLVSTSSPFTVVLTRQASVAPPTCVVPVDHFPYAMTRRHLLVAYRAWRVANASAVAVQSMQWPTERDSHVVVDEDATGKHGRRQLLRTRLTTYFTVVSDRRLQVRFVVEGSVTEHAKLCAMAFAPPNEADMVEYYRAPGSWEMLAQATLHYERVG